MDIMDSREFKSRLSCAFKAMRKAGLMALQSYKCCQGCAGAAVEERVKQMSEAEREALKGVALYTQQDAMPREDSRNFRHFDGLYVGYGPVCVSELKREFGLPRVEVGNLVKCCLEEAGLTVEWDGDESSRIFVRMRARRINA